MVNYTGKRLRRIRRTLSYSHTPRPKGRPAGVMIFFNVNEKFPDKQKRFSTGRGAEMEDRFSRTRMVLGEEGLAKLAAARVAVFGVGGVGGYAVEALARAGVGALDLIDNDVVSESNINRQIIALTDTVGEYKTDAAAARIARINPACEVRTFRTFFLPETADAFDFTAYDYVVDAIDTVTGKLELALRAQAADTPILCSLGTGNKLDPALLRISDVYETRTDPLARIMRTECRKRGIRRLRVVWSPEKPIRPTETVSDGTRRSVPGSVSFVPGAAGLLIASAVVRDLTGIRGNGI